MAERHGLVPPAVAALDLGVALDLRHLTGHPLDCLRLLLAADILRRLAEHRTGGRAQVAVLGRGWQPLGWCQDVIDPFHLAPATIWCTTAQQLSAALGSSPRVLLVSARPDQPGDIPHASRALRVGPVLAAAPEADLAPLWQRTDPLVMRMALLRATPSSPVVLSAARLRRADETLYRWRCKVAAWRDAVPAPTDHLGTLYDVLLRGLDTGAVLRLMHHIERDHTIASGAKYRTFIAVDKVLALDVTRRPVATAAW